VADVTPTVIVAIVGAVATVSAAVVGGVVALKTGRHQAEASLRVVEQQTRAALQSQAQAWSREDALHRKQVYADFIAVASRAVGTWLYFSSESRSKSEPAKRYIRLGDVPSSPSPAMSRDKDFMTTLDADFAEFQTLTAQLEILAPRGLRESAENVTTIINGLQEFLKEHPYEDLEQHPLPENLTASAMREGFEGVRNSFLEAVHEYDAGPDGS
jgi:hypothetical protein